MKRRITSWGGGSATPSRIVDLAPQFAFNETHAPYLVHGMGRSYGDVALLDHGTVINARAMSSIHAFDAEKGILRCDAGCDLEAVIEYVAPFGWMVPVIPGTRFVTIGGAIANDIHGKNHHRRGSFGDHVRSLTLMRSDGVVLTCSRTENEALFGATIGGLGLTGVILQVDLALMKIPSTQIAYVDVKTNSLTETLAVLAEMDVKHEFSVAWIDLLCGRQQRGRGIVSGGDHTEAPTTAARVFSPPGTRTIATIGRQLLYRPIMRAGNAARYAMRPRHRTGTTDFQTFFHPLDALADWNLVYGSRGFFQYQFVVPMEGGEHSLNAIFDLFETWKVPIYLAVVKHFGPSRSPGMLSFPMEGITVALDLPNVGEAALRAMDACDAIVHAKGGRVYLAKDARLSSHMFRLMYPMTERFIAHIDPMMSSRMWTRLQGTLE